MTRPGLERLGPYKLVRNLTRPGRAEVYVGQLDPDAEAKAKEQLSRLPDVAVIKVLRAPENVDPSNMPRVQEAMARFIEEGRLGTRLRHPSITRTYGVALDRRQGQHFIIQEFVEGVTLAQILDWCAGREQPLHITVVLRLVIPILKALHHAYHDALREDGRPLRVVHRDIKPANIMLTYEGRVVLLDLASARSTSFTRQATVQDVVLGTAHYLAPEQVFDLENVGHHTDVFAAGVVLYELASLMPLLPRTRKLSEIANALASFRFSDHASYIDEARYPGMARVLEKALATKPAERYQTSGEMARELEGLLLKAGDGPGLAPFASELRRQLEGGGSVEEPSDARGGDVRSTGAKGPRQNIAGGSAADKGGARGMGSGGARPEPPRPDPVPLELSIPESAVGSAAPPAPGMSVSGTSGSGSSAAATSSLGSSGAVTSSAGSSSAGSSAAGPVSAPSLAPPLAPSVSLNQVGVMQLSSSESGGGGAVSRAPAPEGRRWSELVIAALVGMTMAAGTWMLLQSCGG